MTAICEIEPGPELALLSQSAAGPAGIDEPSYRGKLAEAMALHGSRTCLLPLACLLAGIHRPVSGMLDIAAAALGVPAGPWYSGDYMGLTPAKTEAARIVDQAAPYFASWARPPGGRAREEVMISLGGIDAGPRNRAFGPDSALHQAAHLALSVSPQDFLALLAPVAKQNRCLWTYAALQLTTGVPVLVCSAIDLASSLPGGDQKFAAQALTGYASLEPQEAERAWPDLAGWRPFGTASIGQSLALAMGRCTDG